jgi:hypothetical protein
MVVAVVRIVVVERELYVVVAVTVVVVESSNAG